MIPVEMIGYDFIGTESRREVIVCALYDIRTANPRANVVDVMDAVDRYLTYWESKK